MDSRRGVERIGEGFCPICGEPFTDPQDLYQHLLDHCDDGAFVPDEYIMEAYSLALAAALDFEDEQGDI